MGHILSVILGLKLMNSKIRETIFRETCITVRLVRNLSVCAIIISIRGVIMFQKGVAILNVYNQLKLDCEQKNGMVSVLSVVYSYQP